MSVGLALIGLAAVGLAGCNKGGNANANRGPFSNSAPLPAPPPNTGFAPAPNPGQPQVSSSELTAAMAIAAAQLNQSTPIRVDPETTVTHVRAEGTNIIYEVMISRDIPTAQIETMRQTMQSLNQATLCRQPQTAQMIGMGASMTHEFTDASGDRFQTRLSSCG
jgi:hypothetical protein